MTKIKLVLKLVFMLLEVMLIQYVSAADITQKGACVQFAYRVPADPSAVFGSSPPPAATWWKLIFVSGGGHLVGGNSDRHDKCAL